jgi:hypothetical protein
MSKYRRRPLPDLCTEQGRYQPRMYCQHFGSHPKHDKPRAAPQSGISVASGSSKQKRTLKRGEIIDAIYGTSRNSELSRADLVRLRIVTAR